MLHTTKTYEIGNTIYFECFYRNINGYPADPLDAVWTIKNAKGVIVATGNPNKRQDGIWYFFWTPITIGDYILTFTGSIEDNVVAVRRKFKVIETKIQE